MLVHFLAPGTALVLRMHWPWTSIMQGNND
jgi:hypothetical protein